MSKRNSVQRAFDAFGRNHFREKRSGWWCRESHGVEQKLNLQKSQYSLRYYLNLAIAFDGAVPPHLAEHEDDLGIGKYLEGRVEGLLPEAIDEELRQLLDIDDFPLAEEQREHRLLNLLEQHAKPLLDGLYSLEGLHAAYRENDLDHRVLLTGSGRRVLESL
jgi:hypothetical protein